MYSKKNTSFLDSTETFLKDGFWQIFRVKPIILFFIITSIFIIKKTEKYGAWTTSTPFSSDVDQYYSYLPQIIIQKDPSFKTATRYWAVQQANGNKIQRFTIGVALMELPFFMIAHWAAPHYGYPADGYSAPYAWVLYTGMLMYVFAGLYFIYRSLRFFYGEWFSTLMVICLLFATNLFYYSIAEGLMSHSFLFFLQSGFIFFVLSWYQSGKIKHLIGFCFFGGLAMLIRPTEILIFILPALLGISSKIDLMERIKFLKERKLQILFGILIVFLVFLPQLIYWKTYSGRWLYYSYGEEGFFFGNPKILEFWFGYRKGLIPYTPIMICALIGFIFLWKNNRKLFIGILIFTLINSYVLSCWWDYGYGGSFGNRALIQSFSSLIFPLAAFFHWMINFPKSLKIKTLTLISSMLIIYFSVKLNLIMSLQYRQTIIHWNGMNKETYWFVFMKEEFTAEDFQKREQLIKMPNYSKMIKGERD